MLALLGYSAYGLKPPSEEDPPEVEAEPGWVCNVDARTRGGFAEFEDVVEVTQGESGLMPGLLVGRYAVAKDGLHNEV